MQICCTCVVVGAVGVLVVVIVPVLGGEHHACVVFHGVRQISRQMREVNGVVALWTIKVKSVFDEAPALFPVFQVDVKDRVALSSQRLDLPETQPKLTCERDIIESLERTCLTSTFEKKTCRGAGILTEVTHITNVIIMI